MDLKPQILCQPNIPKPLHGISPRTILGNAWWNREREKVYQSSDYHCIACGVHKTKAIEHQWLEAHEWWDINTATGICTIKSIEPLCHYCHNFIHSGRLAELIDKEIPGWKVDAILEHGFRILSENQLQCFHGTRILAEERFIDTLHVPWTELWVNPDLKWSDWCLQWNGKEYHSKFHNLREWAEFYKVTV